MSRLPTGVTVLTAVGADRHEVMTANAVTSVSLEPALLLASVKADCRWLAAARATGAFAVNVLAQHHEHLARWCASKTRHDQPHLVAEAAPMRVSAQTGLLLVDDALFAVECSVHSLVPAGDHVLVLGEVTAVHVHDTATTPLVFFNRGYATVRDEQPLLHPVYPAVPEVPAAVASG
jgi:flavin reductase (DIM6/NTAB) family NADH-FMN oxidoreductase RutF